MLGVLWLMSWKPPNWHRSNCVLFQCTKNDVKSVTPQHPKYADTVWGEWARLSLRLASVLDYHRVRCLSTSLFHRWRLVHWCLSFTTATPNPLSTNILLISNDISFVISSPLMLVIHANTFIRWYAYPFTTAMLHLLSISTVRWHLV